MFALVPCFILCGTGAVLLRYWEWFPFYFLRIVPSALWPMIVTVIVRICWRIELECLDRSQQSPVFRVASPGQCVPFF